MINFKKSKEKLEINQINKEISEKFEKILFEQSSVDKKFTMKEDSNYQKEVGFFVKINKKKIFSELHSFRPSSDKVLDIDKENLKTFFSNFEKEIKSDVIPIFEKQIKSLEENYLAVIEAKSNERNSENLIHLAKIEEKESMIFAAHQELAKKDNENTQLNNILENLEQKIKNFEDYFESKRKSDYLLGSKSNDSKKLIKDKSSWKLDQLLEQIAVKEEEIMVSKLTILKVENELEKQKVKISIFEEQEKKSFEFYAIWENKRKEIEEGLVQQTENYNNLMLEKLKLSKELDSSKDLLNSFSKKVSNLTKELENTQISLEVSHNEYAKLRKVNAISKLKLGSVLIADVSRNFLPKSVGNYITYVETGILASEINSTTNKTVWFLVSIFFVYSFVFGILKITRLISKFFKILFGRKVKSKEN